MTPLPFDRTKYASQIMTVKECAHYLKVNQSTIYKLLKRGALPAFKVGSDWRFNIEDIDAWRLGKKT